jgi:hypothetical protein
MIDLTSPSPSSSYINNVKKYDESLMFDSNIKHEDFRYIFS